MNEPSASWMEWVAVVVAPVVLLVGLFGLLALLLFIALIRSLVLFVDSAYELWLTWARLRAMGWHLTEEGMAGLFGGYEVCVRNTTSKYNIHVLRTHYRMRLTIKLRGVPQQMELYQATGLLLPPDELPTNHPYQGDEAFDRHYECVVWELPEVRDWLCDARRRAILVQLREIVATVELVKGVLTVSMPFRVHRHRPFVNLMQW